MQNPIEKRACPTDNNKMLFLRQFLIAGKIRERIAWCWLLCSVVTGKCIAFGTFIIQYYANISVVRDAF